jgi:hypothetical protein
MSVQKLLNVIHMLYTWEVPPLLLLLRLPLLHRIESMFVISTFTTVACAWIVSTYLPLTCGYSTLEESIPTPGGDDKLLLLMLDGWRWDYFDQPGLHFPGFQRMHREGVRVERLIPDFPSSSYPNYYTLMTGMLDWYPNAMFMLEHDVEHN